jgi:hypothetical protein
MRTVWRNAATPLPSHAAWRVRLDRKNRQQGTSAPTLAAAWAGPIELFGALRAQPLLADLAVDEIVVEGQSSVDAFSGPRNHDLVVRGHLRDGVRVVVCVEAKAGETFGDTVAGQTRAAATATAKAEQRTAETGKRHTSNASPRLDALLQRFVSDPPSEQHVRELPYQLLTALAGTISEADVQGARHAVLMVHEFLTDERRDDRVIERHDNDLSNFCATVFAVDPPGRQHVPWCIQVPAPAGTSGLKLYLARAVTDLRASTLEPETGGT